MEQFRQIGEALGSLKATMVFRESIQINQRQCCLLLDVFSYAYESIADEIIQNMKFEEKSNKWKVLEQPLREIHKIFKEGEAYIRHCLETKDWWAKAITLYQNTDCVEFHIHNLLCCMPIVIEAIESAGETSGCDLDDMQRKRLINSNKYRKEYRDMKLFQWKFGKQYLVTHDFCNRYDTVWKEDKWFLSNKIHEKIMSGPTKYEKKLIDLLLRNLAKSESLEASLLPSSILLGSKDYQVRRRMGNGSQYKEILWLGESFVMRHFVGDIEASEPEIKEILSLSHPNIMDYLCGFTDEEKKECFLLTELMSKTLSNHIKEIHGPRKRIPFLLHVAVDIMLQIARGMEYLHSKKLYHGELNPSNILVKSRGTSPEGYLHAKVSGFGLPSVKDFNQKVNANQNGILPFIWYSPEVLEEQEISGGAANSKYTEKSDVYSFGMVCFELLTGKVPFEDSHLQGEKMSRNIRAGERPLFPLNSPKYVINLTKRCWHNDPNQRPSFSSICRVLRYIKRFLVLNPGHNSQPDSPPVPPGDFCDIESVLLRKFPSWGSSESSPVSIIPFQMYAYQVIEREKISTFYKDNSESGSDASACGDELVTSGDEPFPSTTERKSILGHDSINRKILLTRKSLDVKITKQPGTPKGRSTRPPQMSPRVRSLRTSSENHIISSPRVIRRVSSGHLSDSELS